MLQLPQQLGNSVEWGFSSKNHILGIAKKLAKFLSDLIDLS